MKTTHKLKTLLTDGSAFLLIALLTVTACNEQRPDDTKEVAEDRNEEKFETNKSEKDAQFLVDAAEINLMEIQLAQLANTKATAQDVKDLAKMMEEAHTNSMNELKTLAASKSISIPTTVTEDGHDHHKKLADKSGEDFDKEYCDMMVKGHKDAIDKFEKASNDAVDADIKQWASATLPALRNHLDHATTCQDRMKKK
jgi:putative membrane protein